LDTVFNWTLKKPLTRLWLEVGVPPPKNVLSELLTSQQLNLVAVDPLFCPHSELWASNHQACGFLNLTEDTQHWNFPQTLTNFLASGSKSVYMTFGSLQAAVPEWAMDLFVEAANLAGIRAIIQSSSERYLADTQLDNIYFIGKHPHQRVFEHCTAVVHHGGAGTSHAATRAGCPSIVVPFMDEQLYWAKQLQALGLAGKPLPAKKVTAMTLAAGIRSVLDSVAMAEKAQQARMMMQPDQGVAKALQLISRALKI
jgi:UDP:flavonoid glycosyltransferase YjiC (YdhE family)